ncbi:MAG: hypothetical protein P9L94_06235 [Candidatus Hinthialibacter antarcticus]|nr:hypothetical protein [Candidatus Hinthialibacter antarcticus]
MNRIVICAAMPMETRSICRRLDIPLLTPKRTVAKAQSPFSDTELVVIASGVGCQRMQAQLDALPDAPTACWLSIGAAGGLRPDIAVGSCLRGTDVVTDSGDVRFESTWIGDGSSTLYCSETPLLTPQSKAESHERLGADLVDMESAAVARHAKSRGECFAWIKAVSDGAEEAIPAEALQCIGVDGFPNIGASLRTLARKPWALGSLIQLGVRASKLDSVLADAVFEFINQFEFKGSCNA